MTKKEIIARLAEEKAVEGICAAVAHTSVMTADVEDLAQVVYLALLEYAEEKVVTMWKEGALRFFIARVVMNQYRSVNSPFFVQVRKFRSRCVELKPGAAYAGAVCENEAGGWHRHR